MSDTTDAELRAHTVRLELVDEPGELLRALEPIADRGGNLLSIFHERGNITPRGQIPVEIDLECPEGRLEEIVGALREEGINVIQTDQQRYGEAVSVVLVGDLVGTDLSDTIAGIEDSSQATVRDVDLSAPAGGDGEASARIHIGAESGSVEAALRTVREIADRKGLRVIEPLVEP
ncbi:MAG: amino acid-binding protein [Halobacteriaceae archaeon]